MKKKTNKTGRYAILGISVIVLCAVFIAFLLKTTGVDETDTQVMAESISGEAITEGVRDGSLGESSIAEDASDGVSGESESINNKKSDSTDTGVMGDGADSDVLAENASDAGDDSMDDGLQSDATEVKSDSSEDGDLNDSAKSSDSAANGVNATTPQTSESEGNSGTETSQTSESERNSEAETSQTSESGQNSGTENPQSSESVQNSDAESQADAAQATTSQTPSTGGHIIVIDPGHQGSGMSEKEPNGPGSSTMKAKVTSGTSGKTSGLAEYQLTLAVGLKLRDELVNRGYTVVMTRESNDVQLSNVDRAQIANNAGAEAFIRIHANGSDDTSVNGAMTICQTPSNPYNSAYYSQSRALSDCVLDAFVASTGCKKQKVWETDTMTGINWANVPSTIIEMGYMSNPIEDSNMASEAYQQQMVTGMANGIDNFFAR